MASPNLDDSDLLTRLAGKSHAELLLIRKNASQSAASQAILGPIEHRAFAREFVEDEGKMGALGMAIAIPAYSAAKALGLTSARSPASFAEMKQGFAGVAEGLRRNRR